MSDWREGCERCKQILRYGGMGHTMSIHSRNDDVILQFGLKKPAFRIVVNTPTTHGSIGLTTGLDPAMTLGLRRLRRQHHVRQHLAAAPAEHQAPRVRGHAGRASQARSRNRGAAPQRPAPTGCRRRRRPLQPGGIAAAPLARRIDQFLVSRGFSGYGTGGVRCGADARGSTVRALAEGCAIARTVGTVYQTRSTSSAKTTCGRRCGRAAKLVIGERTIVTPAARDLGEQHRLFVQADWPR